MISPSDMNATAPASPLLSPQGGQGPSADPNDSAGSGTTFAAAMAQASENPASAAPGNAGSRAANSTSAPTDRVAANVPTPAAPTAQSDSPSASSSTQAQPATSANPTPALPGRAKATNAAGLLDAGAITLPTATPSSTSIPPMPVTEQDASAARNTQPADLAAQGLDESAQDLAQKATAVAARPIPDSTAAKTSGTHREISAKGKTNDKSASTSIGTQTDASAAASTPVLLTDTSKATVADASILTQSATTPAGTGADTIAGLVAAQSFAAARPAPPPALAATSQNLTSVTPSVSAAASNSGRAAASQISDTLAAGKIAIAQTDTSGTTTTPVGVSVSGIASLASQPASAQNFSALLAGSAAAGARPDAAPAMLVPDGKAGTQSAPTGTLPGFAALFASSQASKTERASAVQDSVISDIGSVTAPSSNLSSLLAAGPGTGAGGTPVMDGPRVLVHVGTPVNDPGFGQDVSRQIVYLSKTGVQSAELTLQPANLGPVSVSIQMNGVQASLAITASHETTRAALQNALPHLNQLFAQNGLQLMGAQVGDGSQYQNNPGQQQRAPGGPANGPLQTATTTLSVPIGAPARQAGGLGLIDTFA